MKRNPTNNGFTLVEIMVVVVIIGLMAAMAVPAFVKTREASKHARFARDMRTFSDLVETFTMEQGNYPENSDSGVIPTGFDQYIKVGDWESGPAIGGVYDVEFEGSGGVTSAIGVHNFTINDDELIRFDTNFDDGSLTSGNYRLLEAGRYYYVIAE